MTLDRDVLLVGLHRLGVPGFAALAILVGSAWVEWVCAPMMMSDTAAFHSKALAERDRKAVARPADTAQETLAAIQARLPDDRQSNDTLAALLKAAKTQGLAVDAVQFHTEPSRMPGVVRHQVQVPVKGAYDALRTWISTSLREHPGVSLDSLDIKRKDASSGELEAQAVLSLWADTSRSPSSGNAVHHAD